jgi:hypothetical protein
VFATPFAAQINTLYGNGRIPELYRNFEMPSFQITAFPAPISTWPNRPGGDWKETFHILLDKSLALIDQTNASLFLASCGSYGLPLCREVYNRTKLVSIYSGHAPNNLLGVLTGRFVDGAGGLSLNKSVFMPSHLRDIPNVDLIDGGSYV